MYASLDDLIQTCGLDSEVNFSPKIVLNMIVKNESKIIERLLNSVLGIVDAYCISDTGSTDDTREKIRNIMEAAHIPGEVYDEPFQNFGYNRTHALRRAETWGDYALLLDADMKLVIGSNFKKTDLKLDGYTLVQHGGHLMYSNTRFVRLKRGVTCVGPTHEYYDFPPGLTNGHIDSIWIEDVGDGGSKSDKFIRDVRLLSTALHTDPENVRYHFYLGQSYKDSGDFENALYHYQRRVDLGGWPEEVFYSLLQMGHMYNKLGQKEKAISVWLDAYDKHPARSESLYEICKMFRIDGKYSAAFAFYEMGASIPMPTKDVLFINKDVYTKLWYYEFTVIAYYLKKPIDHYRYIDLAYKYSHTQNMLGNYKFYVKHVTKLPEATVVCFNDSCTKTIGDRVVPMTSSTPSLLRNKDGTYLMNVRYVSYTIKPDGSYIMNNDEQKITTLQKRVRLAQDFSILTSEWIDKVHNVELQYQGVEDVKVFQTNEQLRFFGTVQDPETKKITVGTGAYTGECLRPIAIKSPLGASCEKNWVDCGLEDGSIIYSWNPLRIGKILGVDLQFIQSIESVPECFRDVRGSSNGVRWRDELWFLTHIVSHESPRWYYHMLVVLDANTFAFKRHSIVFKFTETSIEYALGLSVEDTRICITYSIFDSSSYLLELPRTAVETHLFH